jgi:murein DD-endopeptidase MepM/ murein hydrolase activator NlpD
MTVLVLVVFAPVVWILIVRLEGEKPVIDCKLASSALGLSQKIPVFVSDGKSGLRSIWIGLVRDGKTHVLLEETFPGSGFLSGGDIEKESFLVTFEPKKAGVSEGPATLRFVARDYSWRGRLGGNQTVVEKPVTIDTKPPSIHIVTRFHNVAQGGAGLVIYNLSEACPASGVYVGEDFYRGQSGFFNNQQRHMAFFALRYDQDRGTKLFVQATDAAGNRSVAGIPHQILKKKFRKDTIRLSDRFLSTKMPEFQNDLPQTAQLPAIEVFLKVNRDLRKSNYKKIVELVKDTDLKIHWDGVFLRLPNSARRAGFADHRNYHYKKGVVDHQVHLGIDLASIAASPVPAANNGRIVFAENLGIYGNTVIIDHGFGLFSMYSHLSEITVEKDTIVSKGDEIGRTGSTGLAGGDHLHFSMLVHHTFVNPIEWWDASWIENNVSSKIRDSEMNGG